MNRNLSGFIELQLKGLKNSGLYNDIKTLGSPQGAWIEIDGKKLLNFSSNNYLGLANHPRLKDAAIRAIHQYGVGPGAVRTIAGTMDIHIALEKELADFKRVSSVILFQSGFNANLAVIPLLVGKDDVIFSDSLNHASIIDACRLSRAEIKIYEHGDMDHLERLLSEDVKRKRLIVTDGVFSMDGDIAHLPKIVELAHKYSAITVVVDAHGEGVLGEGGRGIVDHFGLHGKVDVEVGTLSKAIGVVGGFVAGNDNLIDYLKQRARPFLFSSALTPPDVSACLEAVKLLKENPGLVERLWENSLYFKDKMSRLGFDIGKSETPITPVMVGDRVKAAELSNLLFQEGVFAQAIGYPTVPEGMARIRVMISALHSKEDLDFGIEKFAKAAMV